MLAAVSDPGPSLCGVPAELTYSLGCGSQGDALGWYALPRWGKWDDGVSDPAFDRCGPKAKCESRGQRAQLQWRRRRLDGGFGCGFSVAGVADPGAARSVKSYRIRRSRRVPHRTFLQSSFACASIPFCLQVDLVFQFHALKRASHTSPGCKRWGSPGNILRVLRKLS